MENRNPDKIFRDICSILDVPVKVVQSEGGQFSSATFDMAAIVSKLMALAIYVGSPVYGAVPMLLNQVHADIEWWKIRMEGGDDNEPERPPEAGDVAAEKKAKEAPGEPDSEAAVAA